MENEFIAPVLHVSVGIAGLWLSIIDAREHRLPNLGTGSLMLVLGTLSVLGASGAELAQAIVCAAASSGALAILALLPPRALGWGDVKLQVGLGFYLGLFSPSLVLVQVAGSFVLGGLVALGGLLSRTLGLRSSLAFGPWMFSATVLAYFLGKSGEII